MASNARALASYVRPFVVRMISGAKYAGVPTRDPGADWKNSCCSIAVYRLAHLQLAYVQGEGKHVRAAKVMRKRQRATCLLVSDGVKTASCADAQPGQGLVLAAAHLRVAEVADLDQRPRLALVEQDVLQLDVAIRYTLRQLFDAVG